MRAAARIAPRAAPRGSLALLGLLLVAPGGAWALGSAEKGDRSITATGAVRVLAGFLHFADQPLLFPSGDDGLAAGEARVILDGGLLRGLDYEAHLYAGLSRQPGFAGLSGLTGGAFATASSFDSPYRTRYLSWDYWRGGSVGGQLGVDRLAFKLHEGPYSVTVGRFPVNYSVTRLFTPNDFFAPFAATAINRLYKPGVDAVRAGVSLGPLSSIEVVGVVGSAADGSATWQKSALLLRASLVRWQIEWAALGGRLADRWVVGGSVQGNIGPIGVRAEGHAGFPDWNADGQLDGPVHGRVAGGVGKEFSWHNVSLAAEYMYLSDGAAAPADYLARARRLFPDDQRYLGQHYVGARVGLDLVPVLKAGAVVLWNAADLSGLALATLSYDIADEATLIAGVMAPWGAQPPPSGAAPGAAGLALQSEFGLTPLTAFLEMRCFF